MYCLKIKKENEDSYRIILEGNLEHATSIKNELEDVFQKKINNAKKIFIDFEDVDLVSTECYKMFQKLKENYPIIIQGNSLFINSKLKEYNLL